jgi:hypothetical protein
MAGPNLEVFKVASHRQQLTLVWDVRDAPHLCNVLLWSSRLLQSICPTCMTFYLWDWWVVEFLAKAGWTASYTVWTSWNQGGDCQVEGGAIEETGTATAEGGWKGCVAVGLGVVCADGPSTFVLLCILPTVRQLSLYSVVLCRRCVWSGCCGFTDEYSIGYDCICDCLNGIATQTKCAGAKRGYIDLLDLDSDRVSHGTGCNAPHGSAT